MFEPEKFFIGLIDFFSILLPGAIVAYLLKLAAPHVDVVLVNRAWWRVQPPAQRARELRALLLGELPAVGAPCYVRVRNLRALDDWDEDWEQVARTAAALPADWWDAVAHLPG